MKKVIMAFCCGIILVSCGKPKEADTPPVETAPPGPVEFGDSKYTEIAKQGFQQLSAGDIDGWMTSYAENAKYYWSAGDSLIGKKAIGDYWKERRSKVIDTLFFDNDIYLSVKVNQPQKGPDRVGNWVFVWTHATTTYNNKKTLSYWVHTDLHFDASDKIDQVVQYLDRAPINAALGKK